MDMPTKNYTEEKLQTVHECLDEAAQDGATAESDNSMVQGSYRAPANIKALAEDICKTNGTSASAFIRKCLERLVKDYLPGSGVR
jgi:hypothetical protein